MFTGDDVTPVDVSDDESESQATTTSVASTSAIIRFERSIP